MSKAKRLVGIVFAVLFAVSAFGCMARTVPTPLEIAGQTQQSGAALQNDGTALTAAGDELSAYLFVYFVSDSGTDGEQIYFSVSQNGYTWEPLKNGTPILKSTVGEHGVRDPHIIRKHDNSGFYIIATDLSIDHGHDYSDNEHRLAWNNGEYVAWGTSQTEGSRAIIVWDSDDLVTWKNMRRCEIARENATCTWAPESIWDEEKGQYMVFWASKTSEDWKQRIYRCYTSDYVNFSEPEVYIERDVSYIDTTFIQEGEWYYRFTKNEDTKYIIMEKSKSLSGPFLAVDTYTINGEPGMDYTKNYGDKVRTGFEGPTGFKMNGEDKWMLLLDGLNEQQGYKPFVTDDLDSGKFVSAAAFDFGGVDFRHGSCIPITGTEYMNLLKTYNNEPDAGSGELIFSLDFENGLTSGGTKGKATAIGTVQYEAEGYKGKAAKVSGVNNYIEISGNDGDHPLKGLTEATISFAVKTYAKSWAFYAAPSAAKPSYQNEKYLGVIWGDSNSSDLAVQRWYNSGSRGPAANAKDLSAGVWHHITISCHEGTTVLYVDGQRKAGVSANRTLSGLLGNDPIAQIGKANWDDGEYSNMLIDSFKIYNYAMNRVQVAAHYAAEKA
ncbi:MAG: hypothetical protein K2M95_07175 [Clostridiales bacterium]|nr:hypothetical protein [Clostridiales bacterium]